MAYYAEINPAGIVLRVVVVDNAQEARDGEGGVGQWLKAHVNGVNEWVKTSYNARSNGFRNKYAAIGDTYDDQKKVFIAPQPYPSWTLDQFNKWQPPVPWPNDGPIYRWNEDTLSWINTEQ